MPPDFLTNWAPVVGPIATTVAVVVSLFVVARDFHWKRTETRRAASAEANAVLLVNKVDERGVQTGIRILNEGEHTIFDLHCWTLDKAGELLTYASTGADHKFIIHIPAHDRKDFRAPDKAATDDNPDIDTLSGIAWRDWNGQNWARLGMFEAFRVKSTGAALKPLRKRQARVRKKTRRERKRRLSG